MLVAKTKNFLLSFPSLFKGLYSLLRHDNKMKLWAALISEFVLYDSRNHSIHHFELSEDLFDPLIQFSWHNIIYARCIECYD
jgi:hypothetical protein